ncbi:MAG: hypothetical protein O9320_16165 [Magnetospirillum sp.]|nr:hypothetical protein [Magnetospirillum sp.]
MVPTEHHAQSILSRYERKLCEIINTAWSQVSNLPGRASYDYKRTIAVLMHQHVMNEVRAEFGESKDVRLLEEHETIRLLINREIVVRLKKMDRRGYTRAQPTQATLALTNELPLPFAYEDLPDIHTIDFGYVLNELETKIEYILVAARLGESVVWSYQPDHDAGEAVVASINPTAPPSIGTPRSNIIKLPATQKGRKDDEK